MKYGINKLFLFALSVFMLFGCRDEHADRFTGTAAVRIAAGDVFSSDPDEHISSLRVIAFNPVRQTVVSNNFYPAGSIGDVITQTMTAGVYDFVILANEPAGASRDELNSVVTRADLEAISFPASAFTSDDDIPMIRTEDGVVILENDQGISIGGGPVVTTWFVTLERLAVRLDIVLRSDIDLGTDFTGVAFSNLPDHVPLFGPYDGTHTTSRTFRTDTPGDGQYLRDTTIAGAVWAKKIHRVIVPSNLFSPADTPERVIVFDMFFSDVNLVMSCTLSLDEENGDYTLPRNKFVTVDAKIQFPMEVNLEVAEWIPQFIDGSPTDRFLNVSNLNPQVYDGAVTRLYFWSNQPSVVVENEGFTGTSGSTTYSVNDLFDNLAGAASPNLTYNPVTGMGFIDIAALSNLTGTTSNRIILNATGLRRELTVTVNLNDLINWDHLHYVGTFHRWNQTGERIISLSQNGPWTAEVVSGDFVILNRNPSPATIAGILGTTNPGDAENYQVPGSATTVSGNGRIYFRVGLTGPAPSPTVPRYALIRVTPASGVISYIYVRQGEAPDVLNSTVSWSVYNVSDPLRGLGGTNIVNHSIFTPQAPVTPTTFADFPTQVGYMFRWNTYDPAAPGTNRAFHPRNPVGNPPSTGITGYPGTPAPVWITANDPCPAGYRHPTNAEFVAFAPNLSNSVWGFYADGFFDRGTIFGDAHVTGALNYQYGTYGRVFYNSVTNASVFMPIAGNRISGIGFLGYLDSGNYSSSNLQFVTSGNVLTFYFSSDTVNPNDVQFAPGRAFSVRCIEN